jgi:hypothetical protein
VTAWHGEPVGKKHDREAFDCGEEALNEFLRRYARKSHELGGAKTFLAIDDADNQTILGFYSLSPPRSTTLVRWKSYGEGWPAMTCRVSYWCACLWIEGCRGWDLADSFCSRLADAACWQRPKLAAWRL